MYDMNALFNSRDVVGCKPNQIIGSRKYKKAPISCYGNRGGSFALWFFIRAFQALTPSLAGIFKSSLSKCQNSGHWGRMIVRFYLRMNSTPEMFLVRL